MPRQKETCFMRALYTRQLNKDGEGKGSMPLPRTVAGEKGRANAKFFPASVKTRVCRGRRESRAVATAFTVVSARTRADTAIPADPGRQRKSRSIHIGRPAGSVMADRVDRRSENEQILLVPR